MDSVEAYYVFFFIDICKAKCPFMKLPLDLQTILFLSSSYLD